MYPETIETANPDHLHTFALKDGGLAYVMYDHGAESPRTWDGNVTQMVTMSSYHLEPDGKHADRDLVAVAHVARLHGMDDAGIKAVLEFDPRKVTDAELENAQEREDEDFLLMAEHGCNRPVVAVKTFAYGERNEANGIAAIFQSDWDALLQGGWCPPPAEEFLDMEVQAYRDYVEGKCYGVIIHDAEGTETESCWGFQGYEYDDPKIVNDNFTAEVES